jgi:hypothetical protein
VSGKWRSNISGQNNGNTNKLRNGICVGYIERTSVGNTECSSSLCLHCVSALVIVLSDSPVKKSENGRLVRFCKRTDRRCAFRWSICDKNCHIIRYISRATVSKVMSAYKNHGQTSAKRNGGRKSKLTGRDRRTLRRIVSKNHRNTAAQVTTELNIHL